MKKHVITLGFLLAIILMAGMVIREVTDPAAKLARDLEGEKCVFAAMALADMGSRAEPAMPALIRALHKDNEQLRLTAAVALGKIGKGAVAPLIRLVSSKDDDVRFYALAALGWIGTDANPAFPAVLASLKHKNPEIRGKAVQTLTLIAKAPQEAAWHLVRSLADPDGDVQNVAVECLVKVGRPAVPTLISALKNKDKSSPYLASQVLGDIGLEADEAVPALASLLGEKQGLRQAAASALGQMGPNAIQALHEGMRDSSRKSVIK